MKPKLVELGAMLEHQLPILVTFVFLRMTGLFAAGTILGAITPKRISPYIHRLFVAFERVRRVAMTIGLVSIAYQVFKVPPDGVCAEYDAVQTQGVSALVSLAVLLTTNDTLASAVAIGALCAVARLSVASLVLSTSAAVISSSGTDTWFFTYILFWIALAHTFWCYNAKYASRTDGSLITVLALVFNVLIYLAKLFYRQCVRLAVSILEQSARVVRMFKRKVN